MNLLRKIKFKLMSKKTFIKDEVATMGPGKAGRKKK